MQQNVPKGFKLPGLLLLAYPFIEIFGFIVAGRFLGIWGTLALIMATTALGAHLLRQAGFDHRRHTSMVAAIQRPQDIVKMLSGFLLLIPGFVSDAAGLLLLFPPVQRLILVVALKRMMPGVQMNNRRTQPEDVKPAANDQQKGDVIDGECWTDDEPNHKK